MRGRIFLCLVLGLAALVKAGESRLRLVGPEGRQHENAIERSATVGQADLRSLPRGARVGLPAPVAKPDLTAPARLEDSYGKLALSFEANRGQVGGHVQFLSRGGGYTVFLTGNEAVLVMRSASQNSKVKGQKSKLKRDEDPENRKSKFQNRPGFESFFPNSLFSPNPEPRPPTVLRMKVVGASPSPQVSGLEELPGKSNYFIGSDPGKWHTDVPTFARVQYENIYPGIDLVYYGNQRRLEYDFVVSPGADPSAITIGFQGAQRIKIDAEGDLVLETQSGEVCLRAPVVYQMQSTINTQQLIVNGNQPARLSPTPNPESRTLRKFLVGRYVFKANQMVGFRVADYDKTKTLVIDPSLTYSTYLGGGNSDLATGIAVDSSGNAYVTGYTRSIDFPATAGAFQTAYGGGSSYGDVFVTKLNATGSALVYSTYLGGSDEDLGNGIAVDSSGNAYVTGYTRSNNFPATAGSFNTSLRGGTCGQSPSTFPCGDAFVTKLNAAGNALVYSTYLGGSHDDWGFGIALDSSANAYVTGYTESADFPTTPGAFETTSSGGICGADPCPDAFVTKLSANGSALVYSTYLGAGGERGYSIAVDSSGDAFITGSTDSPSFPTTAGAFQTAFGQNGDAFVVKLKPDGSGLLYSTYLGGGGGDVGTSIGIDSAGNAYVTGLTDSLSFPTTSGAFQTACRGCVNALHDAFITKLNPAGSALIYSTFLGGSNEDLPFGIALDSAGNTYLTGRTLSTDFPMSNPIQSTCAGGCVNGLNDAFVTELNAAGSALVYSTYLGGSGNDGGYVIALDSAGNAYVAGITTSRDFPTSVGAFRGSSGGAFDAFAIKIDPPNGPAVALSSSSLTFASQDVETASPPQAITLQNVGNEPLAVNSILASGDFSETNTCGASVASVAACNINVTFTPAGGGSTTGSINISDNATGSPQVVSLSGTGVAHPAASLSTATLSFGNQGVGASSSPQTVSLTNTGNGPLTISSIAISGNFSQTNTCGASVAAGANCALSITFTPQATGTRTGTLTLTDNASGSPQTVALSGSGVVPYQLSAVASSAVVIRGADSTNFTLSASSQSGFKASINLSCSGNGPANCTFNPASIVPGQSSTLTFSNLKAVTGNSLGFTVAGASGSESVSLSLTVTLADFSLSASPPESTITAGQTSNYKLTVTPIGGFAQTVSLACSGAPAQASCSISPTSVTLDGSSVSKTSLTVTTTSRSMAVRPPVTTPKIRVPAPGVRVELMVVMCAALIGWLLTWSCRSLPESLSLRLEPERARVGLSSLGYGRAVLFVLLAAATAACGGGGGGGGGTVAGPSGTPAGTYTLTVTGTFNDTSGGTSFSLTHSMTVSLTVN